MIILKIYFDAESSSWWAEADIDDRHALATGAPTLAKLRERIPVILRDLLADQQENTI
jgi:hypothetical protein